MIHGGDVYRNKVNIDFSVSINPMGVPEKVRKALADSILMTEHYPDMNCEALGRKLSAKLGTDAGNIVFGNGASELIMAVTAAFKPRTALLPVPSFGGYKRALENHGCVIKNALLKEENGFLPDRELLRELDRGADMLMIASPNNPTGRYIPRDLLEELLDKCEEQGTMVLLDECFMELSTEPEDNSCIKDIGRWKHLIILRSFTKTFAIPAVRLGYLVCGDKTKTDLIKKHLPEWNVSIAAQAAGEAALDDSGYIKSGRELIIKEREFLSYSLQERGFKVISSDANYLMFNSAGCPGIFDRLLEKGILIRNCESFEGLSRGWYRIAVRTHEENTALIREIDEIRETK